MQVKNRSSAMGNGFGTRSKINIKTDETAIAKRERLTKLNPLCFALKIKSGIFKTRFVKNKGNPKNANKKALSKKTNQIKLTF
jgi:hypothetical protein